jgi:putative selenate reductase
MKPIPFERFIDICINDYYSKNKIMEIDKSDFFKGDSENVCMKFNGEFLRFPIGPAAGPQTQLCQNLLTAYLTGARFFEVKTVQVVDGKEMQEMISKPCIEAKNIGFNVEWSTELTVEEAKEEYIKASVLMQVFAIELGLSDIKDFVINISVGYSLKGIKSKKISNFIDDLKDASNTEIYKECIELLKKNIHKFKRFKLQDIEKITPHITNTVTLSTMHGAKPEEIFEIAAYLITDKKLNTYVKFNPTLLGYDNVRKILYNLKYHDVVVKIEDFKNDLQFDKAVEIITRLQKLGRENNLNVGIKLTNTLPVYNSRGYLSGENMYMSGKPLYPIAINVAKIFAEKFDGNINISFSAGIDINNVAKVFKTGISPITFSTILLKPRGFINIKDIINEINGKTVSCSKLDVEAIKELAKAAKTDCNYKNRGEGRLLEDTLSIFNCFKIKCALCVDVCPNRANLKVYDEHFESAYQILHIEDRCNECGNCHTFCTRGGYPYFKKPTLYSTLSDFEKSRKSGFVKIEGNKFRVRDEANDVYDYEPDFDKPNEEKEKIQIFLETIIREYPYLI